MKAQPRKKIDHKKMHDMLVAALVESCALNINVFADAEPHMREYYSEYRSTIKQCEAALKKCGYSVR